MKKSRFTDSQIMDALKRVESGISVPDICRELGISTATFYKWRAKFGGMDVPDARRLRELEQENSRLKKLLAEAHLDMHVLRSVLGVKR
jgi:putative transposase